MDPLLIIVSLAFVFCMCALGRIDPAGPLSWRLAAWLATRKSVMVWLMRRAFRTPYSHITSADGTDVYMRRFWLFNPYSVETGKRQGEWAKRPWWREILPSVRLHHIMRADQDRHLHDHPWNARTIILKGWYEEERYSDESPLGRAKREMLAAAPYGKHFGAGRTHLETRIAGYTGRLMFGQYHRITQVPRDGVWTLFITWRKRGSWGFDVDGREVPWREYIAEHSGNVAPTRNPPADPVQPMERTS